MRYKGIICLILGIGGSIVSCNDDWDEHYSRNGSIPEVSLMDMILNDSQLTKSNPDEDRCGLFADLDTDLYGLGSSR